MRPLLRICTAGASAAIAAALVCTTIAAAQATPADAVKAFYAASAKQPFTGLPTGAAWTRVSSRLTASLGQLVVAAQKEQARCQKAHPGDKPPWIEGDMFSSNFEGFTQYVVAETTEPAGGRATVAVDFTYAKGGTPVTWRDQIVVVRDGSRWLIDDVIYAKREGFTSGFGESLRKALTPGSGC